MDNREFSFLIKKKRGWQGSLSLTCRLFTNFHCSRQKGTGAGGRVFNLVLAQILATRRKRKNHWKPPKSGKIRTGSNSQIQIYRFPEMSLENRWRWIGFRCKTTRKVVGKKKLHNQCALRWLAKACCHPLVATNKSTQLFSSHCSLSFFFLHKNQPKQQLPTTTTYFIAEIVATMNGNREKGLKAIGKRWLERLVSQMTPVKGALRR